MYNLPVEVSRHEKIARAVISPRHFDKKRRKVTDRLFRPPTGTDRVSVMRLSYMGSDSCKSKAKEIAAIGAGSEYRGLAVLTAEKIRQTGVDVLDVPADYWGHAEIACGIRVEPDEPPDSENSLRLKHISKQLFDAATIHIDTEPGNESWTGPPL